MAKISDIEAVTEYIENHRAKIPEFPELKDVILDYEQWLTNLTWYGKYIDTDISFAEAKWYRDKINTITNNQLPEDWVPADAAKAAETAAVKPGLLAKLSPSTKYALLASGVAVTAMILYTGPMYLGSYLNSRRQRPQPEPKAPSRFGGLNLASIRTRLSQ